MGASFIQYTVKYYQFCVTQYQFQMKCIAILLTLLITACLSNNCKTVQNVTRHDVFFSFMRSPIDRNLLLFNRCYVRSLAVSEVNTSFVYKVVNRKVSEFLRSKINLLLERKQKLPLFCQNRCLI